MKKMMTILLMAAAMMTIPTGCSSEDPLASDNNGNNWDNTDDGNTTSATSAYTEMTSFNVVIDKTTAEPTSTAEATYPEGITESSKDAFGTVVNIDMANPIASTENGVTITVDGNDVTADHGKTEGICYVVTGTTTDGSLTIEGKADYEVNLNDAEITNTRSTALDLESKNNAFVVLTGSNKLTDGITADDSHKGALYSKGILLFSGTGSLEVNGNYNNGIHGKSNIVFDKGINVYVKSTANHGIKAGDDMMINGGIINVEVSANGAKAINSDTNITINGGRTTLIATGDGKWDEEDQDTKAAAGVACDGIFYMNDGEVNAMATGSGGKGIKADLEAYITNGKIRIITKGGLYYNDGTTENLNYTGDTDRLSSNVTSSPKGMKIGTKEEVDGKTTTYGKLQISGGDIMIRTSGNNAEGIESKGTLDISGGTILVYAHDDAINSTDDLTISGGTVVAVGTNNDAIDANGNLNIKGGTIVAMGASGAEAGLDADESHALYISGGDIFSIGGRIDVKLGSTTQGIVQTTGSIAANSSVEVRSGSTILATFDIPPYSSSNGTILISTKGMTSGNSYTIATGSGTQTVTASNTINSGWGGGPGGGGPGGPGGW